MGHDDSIPARKAHASWLKPGKRFWPVYLAVAVALLAGLILLAGSSRDHARADGPPRTGITITADGSASLAPDVARITGSIRTQAAAAADALSQNDSTLSAVIAALRAAGATDRDISTSGVKLDPIAAPQGGVTGYQGSNQLTVRTTDLSRIGDLIQAMVGAGITDISSVNYALQDPDQLQLLAAEQAIGNARKRAQAVAASLGVQAGNVLNFTFGAPSAVPPPPAPTAAAVPRPATAVAAAPPPPVRPSSFSASTQVTVTFAIAGP